MFRRPLGTDNTPHTATHCNTLQHTATHCNTLQLAQHTRRPEPHILMFRRPLGTDPVTGSVATGALASKTKTHNEIPKEK